MNNEIINFQDKFNRFADTWAPKVIAELNDYQFKLARLEGEFVWHRHTDTDEAFIVIEGTLEITLRDRSILLQAGEMFVVPKGVEHKPIAENECKVLLIEPNGVKNTGGTPSDLSADNDIWI